ncbi:3-hydroxyacyl-CoA dehydrogenase NAD-binding protein [Rhodomicrobium vannielii ATCC 17100]|uniref:enoyl-CoA hydratase n=1 Tax=Rhodomicrobium vannielii (strain ATCC 17100 / DSM 162 / LMG 4299 / NCIMB 10020 / ATH 3.1.1) TaxID=648757 RepID=E3I1B2_RHOVT|nr:3-hydroxyacyl-CoA dehydrogenase NAD-binding domain-containing protein [Rhodomicrobium vannielii]ADP70125.1 3-hydroxyacyl-CoA dehydrogenase NAD-binding protein [Rhodomicrobium vannielii ATCC 17100]
MSADIANLKHWQYTIDLERIAWAVFDVKGQSHNTLGREQFAELDRIVTAVAHGAQDRTVRGLVIMSGKDKSFIAGANIKEFDDLKTEEDVIEAVRAGTAVFDRIEALPVPVVAAINGACLGGGLEFALACHYRIATREDATRIGLPEVKLGIIPGLNGSARWLRQAGPMSAMPPMLAGKLLRPGQARAAGAVDQLVPTRHELKWAARKAVLKNAHSQPSRAWQPLLMFEPGRAFLANRMRKETAAKVRAEHYPAPFRLIDLFEKHGGSFDDMKRAETKFFAPLMISDQSRNLRRVFRLSEMLKAEAPKDGWRPARAHVIGAGTMGADIAMACVREGMEVSLQDNSPEAVEKALKRADAFFKKRMRSPLEAEKAKARLLADPQGAQIHRADVVIEAIYENLDAKRAVFAEVEPKLKPGALLATNTSSLKIEDIASALQDPSRLIGLHFFNPVTVLPLVEVVKGADSREEEIRRGAAFVTRIGKLPLIVKSSPGFLVNRTLAPYMFGAMQKLAEGTPKEKIDAAAEEFGMPVGPIELVDIVGLDVALSVAKILKLPTPDDHPLMQLVAEKKLGKKTGEGFYKWVDGKREKPATAPNFAKADLSVLGRELIAPLIDESEKALADGVVADADHVDAGAVFGAGFAPFRGGPLHYRASLKARENGAAKTGGEPVHAG